MRADTGEPDLRTPSAFSPILRVFKFVPLQMWTILVLFIAVGFLSPLFYMPKNLAYFFRQNTPAAFLAIGECFVILSGGFDLSIGSTMSFISALASGLMVARFENLWWVLLLCLAIGFGIGFVNGIITTKLKVPSFLTTLGMMIILQGAALVYTGGMPKGGFPDEFRNFGLGRLFGVPYIVLILVLVAVIAQIFLRKTEIGRSILAVGGNDIASNLMGIRVDRVRILCFILSSFFSSLGTLLMVSTFRVWDVNMGFNMEFEAITMVIVGGAAIGGGKGSVGTTIIGWIIMSMLFTLLNLLGFPQSGRLLAQGVVVLFAVFTNVEARRGVS
jgi:ribose transport system permease protein